MSGHFHPEKRRIIYGFFHFCYRYFADSGYCAGLGVWGVVNLLEGYGSDNPGANGQGP
ncbi:hypothetical protein OBV_24820 [Oscillibacter valericigenes Sjm18-20]|nr:hypothetical protein OBV_24820 [Oscillibacter valericigenes Sjm18-20]